MAAGNLRLVFLQLMQMTAIARDATASAVCPALQDISVTQEFCHELLCLPAAQMPLDMTALPAVSSFGCGRQCIWQHWKDRDSEALQKHAHHSATLGSGADMAAGNLRLVFLQLMQMTAIARDATASAVCPALQDISVTQEFCHELLCLPAAQMPLDMTALPAVSSFGCGRQCIWQHWKDRDSEALQKHAHHSATLGSGADMAAGNLRLVFLQLMQMTAIARDATASAVCPALQDISVTQEFCHELLCLPAAQMPLDMTALPAVSSFGCGRQCIWQHWKDRDSEALQKHAHHSATLGSGADMAAGNLRLVFLQLLYSQLPQARALREPGAKEEATQLLALHANKKLVKKRIEEKTWKLVLLKDLSNAASSLIPQARNDLIKTAALLQNEHGTDYHILADGENFQGILLSNDSMPSNRYAYPEFLGIDATYMFLEIRTPVYVMHVEDSNGDTETVCVAILVNESAPTIK
ncbi:hypothetical protein MTO96_012086 [Rhipicephalus appendiculatus]